MPGGQIVSLDRKESPARLTTHGVHWFAQQAFFGHRPGDDELFNATLERYRDTSLQLLQESALLQDVQWDQPGAQAEVWSRVEGKDSLKERWALPLGQAAHHALNAIAAGDPESAARHTFNATAAHAMVVFCGQLGDTLWQGYMAEGIAALRQLLADWSRQSDRDDEDYWQTTLLTNSFLLSQLFASPMVVHEDQAYVGGKRLDARGGQITDFVLRNELTTAVALVEIKTPATQLLAKAEYRAGIYGAAPGLVGAVAQVTTNCDTLTKTFFAIAGGRDPGWQPFNPRMYVLAGSSSELDSPERRRSFELYRSHLSGVSVVTFDELFARAQALLELAAVAPAPPASPPLS